MSNFVENLFGLLEEKEMSMSDLARALGMNVRVLNNMKKYNPKIKTALKIVDYFSSSIDYFEGKVDCLVCKPLSNYQLNLYENMIKELKEQKISRAQASRDTGIGESSFDRWKKGVLPPYESLVTIANYLHCSIDKLLGRKYEILKH